VGNRRISNGILCLLYCGCKCSDLSHRYGSVTSCGGYRLPDHAQKSFQEPRCVADFLSEPNVVVLCDRPPHENPDQRRVDDKIRQKLIARGYRVIVGRWNEGFETAIGHYPEVFRSNRERLATEGQKRHCGRI